MTESAHQPHESDSNNADDVENLQDIADKPAVESLSTAKRRGEAVTPGDIHLIPVPKEAWKEPEDRRQDSVIDEIGKQTNTRGRKSMWLMRTKRFCHEASVVGLRYVVSPSASPFRRSVWAVLLIFGTLFTTFQIYDRICYYLSRPVSVNFWIEHAEEIRFPTVTICNENRITYSAAAHLGKHDSTVG